MSDPSKIFCRDCLTYSSNTRGRCQSCGSPRVLTHPERDNLSIAHIDCDAFYASVEKRDRPELRDKPLIIGGGKRGVVSTCCYIARIRGVHSAQPMFKALKACPEAVVIKPDMAKYVEVGREVRRRMQDLTPMVEPLSIDEAFLDLTGTERLHHGPAAETLARFANDIEKDIGITVSVGLSFNKFLAKVASDLEKPRGFSIIGREEALSFLAEQPVSLIWGVGKAFQKKLASDGITHIRHLQKMDEATLGKAYGTMGLRLYHLARANDKRSVSPERETKSISSETTFNIDIKDAGELSVTLRSLAEKVSARLKKAELAGHTIVLKLKSTDFKIRTRNHRLPDPTQLADKIFRVSHELLLRETDGTAYRLLGVGVSDLYPADVADPADFLNDESEKRADAERAMDKVRAKFGKDAVNVGLIAKLAPPDDGEAE